MREKIEIKERKEQILYRVRRKYFDNNDTAIYTNWE